MVFNITYIGLKLENYCKLVKKFTLMHRMVLETRKQSRTVLSTFTDVMKCIATSIGLSSLAYNELQNVRF